MPATSLENISFRAVIHAYKLAISFSLFSLLLVEHRAVYSDVCVHVHLVCVCSRWWSSLRTLSCHLKVPGLLLSGTCRIFPRIPRGLSPGYLSLVKKDNPTLPMSRKYGVTTGSRVPFKAPVKCDNCTFM